MALIAVRGWSGGLLPAGTALFGTAIVKLTHSPRPRLGCSWQRHLPAVRSPG
jgi:hypothetical protein